MHTDAMTARGKVFNVRLSDEEWERVNRLADGYGLSAASLFRMLLKAEERRVAQPEPQTHPEAAKRFFADVNEAGARKKATEAKIARRQASGAPAAKTTKGKK